VGGGQWAVFLGAAARAATDLIDHIDRIEGASQQRLIRTFALQPDDAHPYVMEGERPCEPQTVARTYSCLCPLAGKVGRVSPQTTADERQPLQYRWDRQNKIFPGTQQPRRATESVALPNADPDSDPDSA
jgi:hypothetical protein